MCNVIIVGNFGKFGHHPFVEYPQRSIDEWSATRTALMVDYNVGAISIGLLWSAANRLTSIGACAPVVC